MTKKMLQGIASGIFLTTSILSFNYYFTDNFQIENEVATFSEQDLQAYLEENDLVTVDKIEYEQILTKIENIEAENPDSTDIVDIEGAIEDIVDIEAKEVTIIIKPGMSSGTVSLLLEEKGLIDDYQQFADYLINNQLETKIKAGEYQLSSELTIKEIAEALT